MEVTLAVGEDFDDSEPIPLVSFPNGQVDRKSADLLKMTLMKKTGERNPRKRVLVGETKRVTYLGTNFETEGSLYTPPYCKYLVGSLNKKTGVMTLRKADVYHMTPRAKAASAAKMPTNDTPNKSHFTREDYTSTHDKMVQSFGSERAKRAWSAAKRNKMDSSAMDSTLVSALNYAEGEMKKAEDEEPKQAVSLTSSFIPPHNANATSPEDVYQLSDIISDDVMSELRTPAATLVRATAQDISSWREKEGRTEYVLSNLANLPKVGGAYKTASILVFSEYLINMYRLGSRQIEKNGLSKLWYVPDLIKSKLVKQYTEQGPSCPSGTGVLSNRMKDKILSSLLILGLMINGYSFYTKTLQQDLKIQSTKILEVSRALGCSTSSEKAVRGQSKHYTVTLTTPLVFTNPSKGRKGRGPR